jgi:hypothetical protein
MAPVAPWRIRAANLAFLLLLPALFLISASLTRRVAPGNPFYAAIEALGSTPQTQTATALFTAATLLGPVAAIMVCLLGVLQLEWRRDPTGFVTTAHVRWSVIPLATLALSVATLGLLSLYAFFENFLPR